jgi:transcriptional regulator with XRE-family HTH domain
MSRNRIVKDIGRNIKSRRDLKGWSQSKLAIESDCSLATLQNIEAGRANPEIETLERILSSLGQKISIISKNIDFTFWPSLGLPIFERSRTCIFQDCS